MHIIYAMHFAIGLPFLTLLASSCRNIARERGLMHARVQQDFSVCETQCFYETDRVLVYKAIVSLMKCLGFAAENATDTEALREFDSLVRKSVPPALEAC